MKDEKIGKRSQLPRLRFPEFRTVGEWRGEQLRKLAKRCTGKNTGGDHIRVLTNSAEHGVVDQRDYFEKDIATQGNLESYYIVEKGDYVYNPRISTHAPVGPISKNNVGAGVMSPLYTVFRFFASDNDFFAYYFKSTHWHQYMRQVSSTGARHDRMSMKNDDFMSMPLPISIPKEQQKIAECLSSLDELIDASIQKLNLLKIYKRGLMQQLFPRQGEAIPRQRFPEFWEAEEWEENILGDLVKIISGKSPSQYQLKEDGIYPFVKVDDLNRCVKYQIDAREYSDDTGGLVPRNAVIFPKRGAAIALNKLRLSDRELLMDTNMMALVPGDVCRSDFLFYYLSHVGLSQIADNSTIPQINNKHIIPFVIFVPLPEEQQRIADCLSSLDDLLTIQSQKIGALKYHKMGLMQQLFPVLNEVQV